MRGTLAALLLAAALTVVPAGAAWGEVSTTQHLPAAACNAGTLNAHSHVPETTGAGFITPAHEAIPGTENVIPCGHGG